MIWFGRKVEHDPNLESADAALREALTQRAKVHARWPLIREISEELAVMREKNNFATRFREAWAEGR